MQAVYDSLAGLGVPDGRIHAEAFGPAALRRRPAPADAPAVPVRFTRSGTETAWTKAAGTLLELAEAAGLAPLSSCRGGVCGSCATRVTAGGIAYRTPPAHETAEGEALLCIAHPVAGGVSLDL